MNDHLAGGDRPTDPNPESSNEEDLRSTAESVRADSGELAEIEDEKIGLEPADPRVDALSARAAELAERIVVKTRAELQLAAEDGG